MIKIKKNMRKYYVRFLNVFNEMTVTIVVLVACASTSEQSSKISKTAYVN